MNLADQRHMEAATGWLGLENWLEANEELERITPNMRSHPDVLRVRWLVYAKAKKWELATEVAQALTKLIPQDSYGWLHLAHSLHAMKRTQEAWDVLVPVANRFPDEFCIYYDLACYACRLGNLQGAWSWLEKAIERSGKTDIRQMALDDPDLELLWSEIAEI